MNSERIETLLDRIACALERISADLSRLAETGVETKRDEKEPNGSGKPVSDPAPSTSFLESFLGSRGITIKVLAKEDPGDRVIDSLSSFLGERYDALSGLLGKIKRAMQQGLPITESLKDRSQQDVSSICQFCTRLHEIAFLEEYQYWRSPTYLIKARTTTLPKAQRFFGGQWLERFILSRVRGVYDRIDATVGGTLGFEYLLNPQIILPNGDDFEMDLLVAMGTSIYWIEAKTGDYQQHVAKYSKFSKLLGLDFNHSFMVLPDMATELCDALSSLFSMTVCNLKTFEETLTNIVREDVVRKDFT